MILANLESERHANSLIDKCKVRTILKGLEPEDQQILKDAIASPSWNINALQQALRARGVVVSYGTLRRHALKECTCGGEFYA